MEQLYLEDFEAGRTFTTAGLTVTEQAIIDFALRWDPQPFHLDARAGERSPYGGLIASGFHTLAICFRLFIQTGVLAAASLGSPGLEEVRWLRPVRPGDTLHAEVEVLEARPSSSKPDRGIARLRYRLLDQDGEEVMELVGIHLLARRPS